MKDNKLEIGDIIEVNTLGIKRRMKVTHIVSDYLCQVSHVLGKYNPIKVRTLLDHGVVEVRNGRIFFTPGRTFKLIKDATSTSH